MLKLFVNINAKIYKCIAAVLFFISVFAVNSSCDLIYYQLEEPASLKRFSKK